tara:strand:+ start:3444 stop:4745 length:1302 start_codon:yes stop_codon:yes gene_type:complete
MTADLIKPQAVVCLLRDTLRLADNPALVAAAREAQRLQALLIPLTCLQPNRWAAEQFGFARAGPAWQRFRMESLLALKADLEQQGSTLWTAEETLSQALQRVSASVEVCCVVTDLPLATEERLENAGLVSNGYRVIALESAELFDEAQLPFALSDLPSTFSKFRKAVEKKHALSPAAPLAVPRLSALHKQPWPDPLEYLAQSGAQALQTVSHLRGGREAGLAYWQGYLESAALSHYKETRNAFEGLYQSSYLSPWLSHGCLSAREIWADVLAYEAQHGANDSTYWLRFELLWREFFHWYSRVSDATLFRKSGPEAREVAGDRGEKRLQRWVAGATGCDIVDASMRELVATGWMSNRARQLVASHLIYESGLDWRLGAAFFEAHLVDYDVASNWGNWAYIAGVGPDPRGGRVFNLEQQAARYDPEGVYQRRWLS